MFLCELGVQSVIAPRNHAPHYGCIISHSAATAAVVNYKEAYVFEKLLRNFSKTYASKEFYSPPLAAA
jgi:hypothetical protein